MKKSLKLTDIVLISAAISGCVSCSDKPKLLVVPGTPPEITLPDICKKDGIPRIDYYPYAEQGRWRTGVHFTCETKQGYSSFRYQNGKLYEIKIKTE